MLGTFYELLVTATVVIQLRVYTGSYRNPYDNPRRLETDDTFHFPDKESEGQRYEGICRRSPGKVVLDQNLRLSDSVHHTVSEKEKEGGQSFCEVKGPLESLILICILGVHAEVC